MKQKRYILIILFVILSSCSNNPSKEALSGSIIEASRNNVNSEVSPEAADCIADGLISSELSDTTLEGLAEDFTRPEILGAESERLQELLSSLTNQCEL